MAPTSRIDISENILRHRGNILNILLLDRTRSTTTRPYNIIWATDSYEKKYNKIISGEGLDFIFLVTPETPVERIKLLDQLSSGFLYAVSSSSTTGKEKNMNDVVEYVDSWLLKEFSQVKTNENASINTESPAWAVDRLSILALKIYHMEQEVNRPDAATDHKQACQKKLSVLLEQRVDLSSSIDQLLKDIEAGVPGFVITSILSVGTI